MTYLYTCITYSAFIFSLYATCLSTQPSTVIHFPKEIHTQIYCSINDIKAHERLRITCTDWKKANDNFSKHFGFLRLLRSLHNATKETKTRILFYAVYTNDNHLAQHILENTNEHLHITVDNGRCVLDPYHYAQKKNNQAMLNLFKKHLYNQPHEKAQWPQDKTEEKLLITAIIGDNIAFKKVLHTNFSQENVYPQLGKKNPTLPRYLHLKEAFCVITQHDDDLCIEPCMQWIQNNSQFTFLNISILDEALKKKCSQVYTNILSKYKGLNAIETWYINGIKREQTLKDKLLWNKGWREPSHYQETEKILNSFGAQTAQELQQQKAPGQSLQTSHR